MTETTTRRLVRAMLVTTGLLGPAALAPTPARAAPELVAFELDYQPGAIVIINAERRLYYVLGGGQAIRYPVAIGNDEEVWTGKQVVTEKKENPSWTSPDDGETIEPGPDNPLGVRALYLGWTLWRIHGTPATWSMGRAVSNGCIRMLNTDVTDLYPRVHVGAPVYAIRTRAESQPVHWARKIVDENE